MDEELTCPVCGGPVESRYGKALIMSRRARTGVYDSDGHEYARVPMREAWIHECTNVDPPCQYAEAGDLIGHGWVADPDLVPLARLLITVQEWRAENGYGSGHEPGE
jgi:hypothetical protein